MAESTHPPGPGGIVSLAAAQAAIAAVTAQASARGVGIVVAVAAASGDLVALARMDGVPPLAAESAARKCRTVALTWRSTASFAASLKDDLDTEPEYFHGMHHVGPLMTVGGGVPIVVDGQLIGVAAVSGASTDDDIALAEVAARTAVEAAG
ncbi:MAG TPA: heme-binding protein [Candidatus Limnocylindrales bacterium]|nr:heme-binding protein [Candidatus Limnocylindrales bacterium]